MNNLPGGFPALQLTGPAGAVPVAGEATMAAVSVIDGQQLHLLGVDSCRGGEVGSEADQTGSFRTPPS